MGQRVGIFGTLSFLIRTGLPRSGARGGPAVRLGSQARMILTFLDPRLGAVLAVPMRIHR